MAARAFLKKKNRTLGHLLWNSFENRKRTFFSRAAKPDAQNSVENLITTRVFHIVFRQEVIANTGTQTAGGW